jgi:hypothetical protein
MREEAKQIVSKLLANKIVYLKTGTEETSVEIDGVVVLEKGHVCPIFLDQSFYLTPLSLSPDGKIYMANWKLNKNFIFAGAEVLDKKIIDKYNTMASRYLDSGCIKRALVFFDN